MASRVDDIRERWLQNVGPPYGLVSANEFIQLAHGDLVYLISLIEKADRMAEASESHTDCIILHHPASSAGKLSPPTGRPGKRESIRAVQGTSLQHPAHARPYLHQQLQGSGSVVGRREGFGSNSISKVQL